MKPQLFISMDALIVPTAEPHPVLGFGGVAPYAKPFLHWAKEHFHVTLLSEHSPRDGHLLLKTLGLPGDAVSVGSYDLTKHERIVGADNFYWVDAGLIPSELAFLCENKKLDRHVSVDPRTGVTPATKTALEKLLR